MYLIIDNSISMFSEHTTYNMGINISVKDGIVLTTPHFTGDISQAALMGLKCPKIWYTEDGAIVKSSLGSVQLFIEDTLLKDYKRLNRDELDSFMKTLSVTHKL